MPATCSHRSRFRRGRWGRVVLLGTLAAATLLAAGCYRRVVGVKGDGYSGPVYEANLPEGQRNAVAELFETRSVRPVDSTGP